MKCALSVARRVGLFMAALPVLGLAFGMAAVAAEKYPTKAVTVIHGFKPGGGSDQLAAVTQPVLEKMLKQRFVNVYKPGADGAIAWKEVGKDTKPDGYTLTTLLTPKTQLNSMVNRDAGYSMADFEPIVNMIFDPGILVVAPDSKYKSLNELIDAAKKAPGTIRVSHSGEGGDDWYNALMIEKLTGAKFNLIPFDGDAPAMQAAMGGHVDAATTNVGVVTGLVRGKKLRGLAVYTQQRLASISEVPTLKELGVNLVEGSYRGYLAPKGTPKEIIKILADAMEKVSKDPQFLEACAAINMIPQFKRDQELKTFLDEEDALLRKVAKDMKLIQ